MPRLIKMLDELASHPFDSGTEFFPPTNLEITTVDVGNTADNIIPAKGVAKFNIRFNELWSSDTLGQKLHDIIKPLGFDYKLELSSSAESFITKPGDWSSVVQDAVKDITGKTAKYTTNGGTSDARFVVNYCPVVEFGGINATIHQVNENASVSDLQHLAKIFERVLERYLG